VNSRVASAVAIARDPFLSEKQPYEKLTVDRHDRSYVL